MTDEIFKERIKAAKTRIRSGIYTSQEDLENEMKQWKKAYRVHLL